ncbi:glycosyltransferase family 4 protein [Hymenobacter koreensis]|uniref:Glycosyltransferase n=1 Tax=Hymenobacter koreensis TaxID=1084523 RepID=A0ABP8IYQ3_9BACT
MKILWLAPFPHPRHPAQHPAPWLTTLAQALAQQPGLELTVLNWESGLDAPVENFERDGIRFVFLRVPASRADILSLYTRRVGIIREYLRRHHHRYNLIHVHGSEMQFQAAVAGLEVPVLLSVQGLISECVKALPDTVSVRRALWSLASYYELKYLPQVREFLCRTHWDKAHIARLSPGARIHHNWEMLRPEFFGAAPRAGMPAAVPQVLFMGGTQVMKGFHETMQAFNLIRQETPARLVLVGDTYAEELVRYIRKAGLRHIEPGDVDCRRFQSSAQLIELFRQSLCLLHPSYIDNSPNSVCEAQVAGLPVVASNVGGVSSLIDDGQTGLLSDLTPRNLAAAVLRLHHDPGFARRLAVQAHQVARLRHDPATILQRTLDTYRGILQIPVPFSVAAPSTAMAETA